MPKKLNLNLDNQDSNAFALLALFAREAKRAGWTKDEIDATRKDATNGDYYHLLQVLIDC